MNQGKVWTKDDVLELLDGSKGAVVKALKALYARQTTDEQSSKATRVQNSRGFKGGIRRVLLAKDGIIVASEAGTETVYRTTL